MISGKSRHRNVHVNLDDYAALHSDSQCTGTFQPLVVPNTHLSMDGLGPVGVPLVPTIHCKICETTFITPGFQDFMEENLARFLITTPALINKRQAKFLRLFFGKTQEYVAKRICNSDRHYYNKLESLNSDHPLDADKQVRIKMLYAELMKIKDSGIFYAINGLSNKSPEAEIDPMRLKAAAEDFIRRRA